TFAQNGTSEWQNVIEPPDEGAEALTMALVVNPDGHSIRIFKDENDIVRGIFTLDDESQSLEEGSCPTVRVDRLPPHPLVHLGGPCELDNPHRVRFTLGVINDSQVQSTMLWQLINGGGFRVWYHLKDRGYREAKFSLRRSMNALVGTLGAQVDVVP
ncbi:MAG TPA: hypothetical protein VLS27_20410, partial [Gammaproteobacteria bacterium]|nr:hypothetical protein [Gammaproteobacteria bacterium]